MKKFPGIFVLFICLVSSVSVFAQDQDMMKAWQDYMTPGEMHKILANNIGEWTAEITMWMDPSQPPTKSEGTSVTEALLDGRYFQTKYTGMIMGMPMNGISLEGYDNAKKTFFSTWIDNMGTGIMLLEGTYDEASKTINYKGTSTDPTGKEVKVREVVKIIDKDNTLFEMYTEQDGKETKSMEIKYTRKK
ncbi:MAG: DUF1579 domain-containing protein [Ignavibacteriales bacterium]|nr:MAG: DUF1579 domain-containing protein [Ignavibacteriales bacterium]